MTDGPETFAELLRLLQTQARGRWAIWHVVLEGREVFFGRRLFHRNGFPCDRLAKMPYHKTICCARCGNGTTFEWPPAAPTEFTALRWLTLCNSCAGLYIGLWPEIFPRFALGVRTQRWGGWGGGPGGNWGELFGNQKIFKLDPDWYRLPPFGPAVEVQPNSLIGRRFRE